MTAIDAGLWLWEQTRGDGPDIPFKHGTSLFRLRSQPFLLAELKNSSRSGEHFFTGFLCVLYGIVILSGFVFN